MSAFDSQGFSVCWLGNAGWQLNIGNLILLIDPDLEDGPHRRVLPADPERFLRKADAVLLTHEHGDHFNRPTIQKLLTNTDCQFVLPASCLYEAGKMGISEKRIQVAHHGKTMQLFGYDLTATPVPAVHGAPKGAVYKDGNRADCGYVISASGVTLFHPGDTILMEEHFFLPKIDILMVSPTEHNTNVLQSTTLIHQLKPQHIFPQHRDTYVITNDNYFWTTAFDKELKRALGEEYADRYHTLEQGVLFEIESK